ncbi:formate dehydrogenase accessory sulfurtransferase FdhD [Planococcus lenghuensis]|uniref:Sulfur carrier protein FdhD n=1 Tax=Planococcus lenghuensis TaxID=2213202 RepID=A0A1Q2L0Y0_9BACL|nr:formate dehydrogenase accessory sulfurtransferase FdhD [Planococcus lenghuensis]AQQ54108.1 formate dehydrogenase family accessory protein FdhD [Planococcus lenghuensis]
MERDTERAVLRYTKEGFAEVEDRVAIEQPLTIKINGKEFMTIVCTPEYMEDMAVGFLASEGIIPNHRDIRNLRLDEEAGVLHVETDKVYPFYEQLLNKRFVSSCCGMSRQGFVFAHDALRVKKMTETRIRLTPADCFRMMEAMEQEAETFHATGGVHNAALCDRHGLVLSRMDIGRHNALDKIYGHCLRNDIPVHDKVVVFSGRISSEILMKVAKIGCEIVLSKSAPTDLALTLAEELGITTVGFIRDGSFNLYTHHERIVSEEKIAYPSFQLEE